MKNKTQAIATLVRLGAESSGLVRKQTPTRRLVNRIRGKETFDMKVAKQIEARAKAAADKQRSKLGDRFKKSA